MKGLLFVNALTYGGAVVSVFYPFIGLLIYICFAIIKPESMWFWSLDPWVYSRIVAIAMIIGWMIQGTGNWKLGRAAAVTGCLVAFNLWGVVGWVVCDVPLYAQAVLQDQAKILLPFLVGITLIDSVARLKQLAWVIVVSQGYLAYTFHVDYYSGFNRVVETPYAGMDNNCIAIAMVTGVGLAVFLGMHERRIWLKGPAFLCAVLMAHVVMFSWSRGGMLALIVMAMVAFFLVPRQLKDYLAFAALVCVGAFLAGPSVRERFMTVFVDPAERDASANARLEYWGYAWDTMKRHPLVGCGPGHWMHDCDLKMRKPVFIHSIWLQCGAEQGFPGLILLMSFYGFCAVRLLPMTRPRARLPDPWLGDAARMVIAALAGFAVAGCFVSLINLEVPYYVTLLGAGALKVASNAKSPPPTWPSTDEPIRQTEPALSGQP